MTDWSRHLNAWGPLAPFKNWPDHMPRPAVEQCYEAEKRAQNAGCYDLVWRMVSQPRDNWFRFWYEPNPKANSRLEVDMDD